MNIYNIYYKKISKNSKLYCDKNTRSIVWKIDNTIKWKYPEISSNNCDLQDKNAENLLDAWKQLSIIYNKNINKFNKYESNDYTVGFNDAINKLEYNI